jgi:hypothetical protein
MTYHEPYMRLTALALCTTTGAYPPSRSPFSGAENGFLGRLYNASVPLSDEWVK